MKSYNKNIIEKGKKKALVTSIIISIFILFSLIYDSVLGISIWSVIKALVGFYGIYNLYKGDTIAFLIVIFYLGIALSFLIATSIFFLLSLFYISELILIVIAVWIFSVISSAVILYKSTSIREIYSFIEYKEGLRKGGRL